MKLKDILGIGDSGAEEVPDMKEEKRVQGKIIKVSDEGWGFISSKDIKFTRIFFHWTSLKQDTLKFTDRDRIEIEENNAIAYLHPTGI